MLLGATFLNLLLKRKTQIFAAEAVVALIVPLLSPELVQGRDVTWYIDNEAAVSSLIRGASRSSDVGHIAVAAHLAMLAIDARPWFEWIDTASNPADGLSRDGLQDEWTRRQNWALQEIPPTQMDTVAEFLSSMAVSAAAWQGEWLLAKR